MKRIARVQVPFEVMRAGEIITWDTMYDGNTRILALIGSGFLEDITEEVDGDDGAPEPRSGGTPTPKGIRAGRKEDPVGDEVAG